MREAVERKGAAYVASGRLTIVEVNAERIRAHARGHGAVYTLGWDPPAHWWCRCPARSRCAHLVALQLVAIAREPDIR